MLLRNARLRRNQHGGLLRRFSQPLPSLEMGHGIRAHVQKLRIWTAQKYEMVINNDPRYAYLLESNAFIDQKLVMCHVSGHNDFFKNNFTFHTPTAK